MLGVKSGTVDPRKVTLQPTEYLTAFTHERYDNYYLASAGLTFTTSFGRTYTYKTDTTTDLEEEITKVTAKKGCHITSISIVKGEYKSHEESAIPAEHAKDASEHRRSWYVLYTQPSAGTNHARNSSDYKKTDSDDLEMQSVSFLNKTPPPPRVQVFVNDKAPPYRAYNLSRARGDTCLLIDALHHKRVLQHGPSATVTSLWDQAVCDGNVAAHQTIAVGIANTLKLLSAMFATPHALKTFVITTTLLAGSSYLDLYLSVITGKTLAMFADPSIQPPTWATPVYCALLPCDETLDPEWSYKCVIFAFGLTALVKSFMYVSNVYVHHNACDQQHCESGVKALRHVLSMDQGWWDTRGLDDVRTSMDAKPVNDFFTWNVPYMICSVLKIVFAFGFMANISVKLTAITAGGMLFAKFTFRRKIELMEEKMHKVRRKLDTKMSQTHNEALDMVSAIKMFSRETHHVSKYSEVYSYAINKCTKRQVVLRCVREFVTATTSVMVFCAAMLLSMEMVKEEEFNAANLTTFFLLFSQFEGIFDSLNWHYDRLLEEFPAIERFMKLQLEKNGLESGDFTVDGSVLERADIHFDGVDFGYPSRPNELSLERFSLRIRGGRMTAIVGDSGAGKSTVTKLIMRLYDPTTGRITIGGRDLRDFDIKTFHDNLGIVPQNPDLFNASIRENICYGVEGGVTDAQLEAAARQANCYDFIMAFSEGFDTFAGNRGLMLSAGQKQRIAIARATIRDPKLLILDEATSSLDASSEALVSQALDRLMVGRTVVVVAHRLCTIKNADDVVVVKGGQVVEQGEYGELLEKRGQFWKLVEKQL